MFGYVRPLKGELKVREYENYKAVYCGLCHTLKSRCGFFGRFVVNFDFTFLAMLLSREEACQYTHRRCVSSPFRKKCVICSEPKLERAADCSVILTWWKLRDTAADEGFFKSLAARAAAILLKPAYRRAAKNAPKFDKRVRDSLNELAILEKEGCESLDMAADKFAGILSAISGSAEGEARKRAETLLLYHVGRIIYILDAVNDLKDDVKRGAYNPLRNRFKLAGDELDAEAQEGVRLTITHSLNLLSSAFQLIEPSPYTPVLENIVYLGIPQVSELVFAGKWRGKNRNPRRETQ